jgi:hypothetical protein
MSAGSAAYEETRSALRWPLLTWGLFVPAGLEIIFLALAAAVNLQWLVAAAVLPFLAPMLILTSLLYRNWPTGVRIDDTGITVGAIRSPRALSRTPSAFHQSWGRYTSPWPQITSARVVTDPAELRHLASRSQHPTFNNSWGSKRAMDHCDIGVMTCPFMRAALVVDLYPSGVTGTTVRPARVYKPLTMLGIPFTTRRIAPRTWDTWIVPTRHPQALEEALKQYRPDPPSDTLPPSAVTKLHGRG